MTLEEMMKTRDANEAFAKEAFAVALDAYIAERDKATGFIWRRAATLL